MVWAPLYASLAEAQEYVNAMDAAGAELARIGVHLDAACRNVDRCAGRQFGKTDEQVDRFYTARWDRRRGRWAVETDDLHGPSSGIEIHFDAEGDGTYDVELTGVLEPKNAPADSKPWEGIRLSLGSNVSDAEDAIRVRTSTWGWEATPDSIKNATLVQVSRYWSRRNAPFGVAGSAEMGSELRLLSRLDPDVEVLVRPFERYWAAV